MTEYLSDLTQRLHYSLPTAQLIESKMPLTPWLKLWLLNDSNMDRPFSPEEVRVIWEAPPYWCFCWASGQIMAKYIEEHPETVRDKVVVDFGAGSGIAAIAAAKFGAKRVIACDIDEDAIMSCKANAELNNVGIEFSDDFFELIQKMDTPDIILAADVLYDRDNIPLLTELRKNCQSILMADSRVKNLDVDGYQAFSEGHAETLPPLERFDEFKHVIIYAAQGTAKE
ncbi:class I SAM-dependent methyltransferase [Litoribrevibacter euphylliae]|uniref:Class I SAM-dependent methyltransferase n=1 Tax=Litoribrevibacter euphylliae TaxID=1834034 RepID=A0ABV7HJ52_9GAMM